MSFSYLANHHGVKCKTAGTVSHTKSDEHPLHRQNQTTKYDLPQNRFSYRVDHTEQTYFVIAMMGGSYKESTLMMNIFGRNFRHVDNLTDVKLEFLSITIFFFSLSKSANVSDRFGLVLLGLSSAEKF